MAEIPRYKEFDNLLEPVIKDSKVIILAKFVGNDSEETTTGLSSKELRELADYLDKKRDE